MRNLYCISHREYDGKSTPNLLCKPCCSIYVSVIKQETAESLAGTPSKKSVAAEFAPGQWLLEKSQQSRKKGSK